MPVPLELVNFPLWTFAPGGNGGDLVVVGLGQPNRRDGQIGFEMRPRGRADDRGGDARSIENRAARHRGDIDAVPVGDAAQAREQFLEQRPSAEIVDDKLVFDQRAVFERACRLPRPQPAVGQKSACDRAVAKETDAIGAGERGEFGFGTRIEERELNCIEISGIFASRICCICLESKLVPPT